MCIWEKPENQRKPLTEKRTETLTSSQTVGLFRSSVTKLLLRKHTSLQPIVNKLLIITRSHCTCISLYGSRAFVRKEWLQVVTDCRSQKRCRQSLASYLVRCIKCIVIINRTITVRRYFFISYSLVFLSNYKIASLYIFSLLITLIALEWEWIRFEKYTKWTLYVIKNNNFISLWSSHTEKYTFVLSNGFGYEQYIFSMFFCETKLNKLLKFDKSKNQEILKNVELVGSQVLRSFFGFAHF